MVLTRRERKRAAAEDSGTEQDDPQLDADFTAKDADTRDSEPESSDDDEDEPTKDGHWLYELAKMHAAMKPPGKFAYLLKTFYAKGPTGSFKRGYNRGDSLPKHIKDALDEVENPYQSCSASHDWVLDAIDIAKDANVIYPGPCAGFSMEAWSVLLADFAADQKNTSAGRRRASELRSASRAMQRLLKVSGTAGRANATYPKPKVCYLCVAAADALLDEYGVNELTFNDYFLLTRAGKVTVINKRKLYRDHLELSTLFRGWLCGFCNHSKIALLDARTTAEYELYQGRLYVNCTSFPSS